MEDQCGGLTGYSKVAGLSRSGHSPTAKPVNSGPDMQLSSSVSLRSPLLNSAAGRRRYHMQIDFLADYPHYLDALAAPVLEH